MPPHWHLAIANPGKLAVLGAGDGGFLMSMADMETAVRLGLRMCILVYNDASYAAEVHYFGRQGFSTDIVKFPDTDFAAIARGYGARAATVRTLADLDPVKTWVAEGAPGVFVIDGKINPNLEADWHAGERRCRWECGPACAGNNLLRAAACLPPWSGCRARTAGLRRL